MGYHHTEASTHDEVRDTALDCFLSSLFSDPQRNTGRKIVLIPDNATIHFNEFSIPSAPSQESPHIRDSRWGNASPLVRDLKSDPFFLNTMQESGMDRWRYGGLDKPCRWGEGEGAKECSLPSPSRGESVKQHGCSKMRMPSQRQRPLRLPTALREPISKNVIDVDDLAATFSAACLQETALSDLY